MIESIVIYVASTWSSQAVGLIGFRYLTKKRGNTAVCMAGCMECLRHHSNTTEWSWPSVADLRDCYDGAHSDYSLFPPSYKISFQKHHGGEPGDFFAVVAPLAMNAWFSVMLLE